MSLLSVKNLSVGYQTPAGVIRAIDNVCFDLETGRPLGFVGESGCGKTTIGMALMGLLPDNGTVLGGDILFRGKNLACFSEKQWRKIRGRDMAMIFQAAMNALNPVYRVADQIREAIITHHPEAAEADLDSRLEELFDLVDMPLERAWDYPHEYSGGMKQRAVIAMALACSPKLVIADEPTTALDVIVQDQILKGLRAIQARLKIGLIFISHDIAVVASVCDRVCVMYGGQIVEAGTTDEVFSSPRHPYTRMLLGAYLSLDSKPDIRVPEMGETPDLFQADGRCRFSVNCPERSADCSSSRPKWIEVSKTHRVFCCNEALIRSINETL